MSTEAAVRHTPIAAAIPALRHPLRSDPKPRAKWPDGLTHLPDGQWLVGLPVAPTAEDRLPWTVDAYLDGRKRVP